MDAQSISNAILNPQQAQPAANTSIVPSVNYSPEQAASWLRNMEKRILEGHTPTLDEQRTIVLLVRHNRFAAAEAANKPSGGKKKKSLSNEDLDADLDAALGL